MFCPGHVQTRLNMFRMEEIKRRKKMFCPGHVQTRLNMFKHV